jgi:glyoxylase-like metal-dependent hydrolase (beta-lactamase superfamily II)
MKVSFVHAGLFKLDGGAMFGVVPKRMWNKLNPSDDNNMCTWSMRCLLIETGDRKILVDTGMGDKQDAKFRSHFEPHGEYNLKSSLMERSLKAEDITDVFLTHLHFDHVGGAISKTEKGELFPTFPNARYHTNQLHYDWAMNPNPRERASFLKENFVELKSLGVLEFINIKHETEAFNWLPGLDVQLYYGHTHAMMGLHINTGDKHLKYVADLMPSSFHVGLPYVMSYDIDPLKSIAEKKAFHQRVLDEKALILFEHDPTNPAATLAVNEKGRTVLGEVQELETYLAPSS